MRITQKIIIQLFVLFILLFVFGCKKKVIKVDPAFEGFWEETTNSSWDNYWCHNDLQITERSSGYFAFCSYDANDDYRKNGKFRINKTHDRLFIDDLELTIDQAPHYVTQGYWSMELNGVVYWTEKDPGSVSACTTPEFCVKNNTSSPIIGSFSDSKSISYGDDTIQPGATLCIPASMLDIVCWLPDGSMYCDGGMIVDCLFTHSIN